MAQKRPASLPCPVPALRSPAAPGVVRSALDARRQPGPGVGERVAACAQREAAVDGRPGVVGDGRRAGARGARAAGVRRGRQAHGGVVQQGRRQLRADQARRPACAAGAQCLRADAHALPWPRLLRQSDGHIIGARGLREG